MTMRKKDMIQLAVIVVLAVVLLGLISRNLKKRRPRRVFREPETFFKDKFAASDSGRRASVYADLVEKTKEIPLTRDPFIEQRVPVDTVSRQLVLSGILRRDEQTWLAVINGRILKVGDKVGEKTIIAIDQDTVTVHDGVHQEELGIVP